VALAYAARPEMADNIEQGSRAASERTNATTLASERGALLPLWVGLLFAFAVLRNAWIGDDSFVTWRALDNLLEGYGWTSDPGQRVQGFTSVLWPLVVALPYALGVDIYWAAMGASLACSFGAVALLLRAARQACAVNAACVGVLWLSLSSAYVDYSTSGLENPLAHLLLASFFLKLIARREGERPGLMFLLAALIGLNRQDHLLLVLPALASLLVTSPRGGGFEMPQLARPLRPIVIAALIGLAPLAAWLVFATVYYGFPFPNTAYAKLTTDIPGQKLAAQGVWYAMASLRRDPLTLLSIALAIGLAFRERSRVSLLVGLGLALYVAYVLRIGGDFMAGRFWAAPMLVAVVWLSAGPLARCAPGELLALAAITSMLGLSMVEHMQADEKLACSVPPSGIVNERHCYFEHNALAENLRSFKYRTHPYYQTGRKLRRSGTRVVESMPGMAGFAAGPSVHIIDGYALTEPLLARIPFRPTDHWRIGHFPRAVPAGYVATLETGRNLIVDPCVHRFYDALRTVIRGPIWSTARFVEIIKLNTGAYDSLLHESCQPSSRI